MHFQSDFTRHIFFTLTIRYEKLQEKHMNLEHTFNEKGYFEDMQRMNQQWLNLFWKPFIG